MNINIENFKNISKYIILCNVQSVDDLTKDQILAWAKSGKMGIATQVSADIVENGLFGEMPDMDMAIRLLKQAILENKEFYCSYLEEESCIEPDDTEHEFFEMSIR